jgi:hypothetical protein
VVTENPYAPIMDDKPTLAPAPRRDGMICSHSRLVVAARLQKIEGSPLTAEDIAMFEKFEREGWSHERRRAYIMTGAAAPVA